MKTFCLALETSEPQITGGWEGILGKGRLKIIIENE